MRTSVMMGLGVAAALAASAAQGRPVSVSVSRGVNANEDSPVLVAVFSQAQYAQIAGGIKSGSALRDAAKPRRAREIKVEAEDGAGPVPTDLFELHDSDKAVICVASTQAGFVSIWTRQAKGNGPQYTSFDKLFPNSYAGSPKEGQKVAADEVLCVGQPGSGFVLRAKYSAGVTEQVYVHVTPSPDNQMDSDDVVVLGKETGAGNTKAVPAVGDYQSGIAGYTVSK